MSVNDEEFKMRVRDTAKFLKEYDALADAQVTPRKKNWYARTFTSSVHFTDAKKCIKLLADVQGKCDKFFYHIVAWLDTMGDLNPHGKREKFLLVNSTLDIAVEFSNAKEFVTKCCHCNQTARIGLGLGAHKTHFDGLIHFVYLASVFRWPSRTIKRSKRWYGARMAREVSQVGILGGGSR